MKAEPAHLTVAEVIKLKSQQMLVVNSEYQRGVVWTPAQKRKLVDSVLRGYPLPLIYLHLIRQEAGKLVAERYEIIDGQQRINALSDFYEGAYKLFDPIADEEEARFPDFIQKQPCPWGRKSFPELNEDLKKCFLETSLPIVQIQTHDPSEARDLFVRLQAGMPLNSQEKRDAWPGQFTDYILRLGGKPDISRYPGHDFFTVLMRAQKAKDRGKFRQLAAQIAVLFFNRREHGNALFCDINAAALDDFYYEHLGFDAASVNAKRLTEILDKLTELLGDQKRSKILGHEAIHLVLLVDSLLDDYTKSWESRFTEAFDTFRRIFAEAKRTRYDARPSDYWLQYGVYTRVNSDRAEVIQRRHEFFSEKMREVLQPKLKDEQRNFGMLERELIYYRDGKRCGVCERDVIWDDGEIHHIEQHSQGGPTVLENGALVHVHCHPKGAQATANFAAKWKALGENRSNVSPAQVNQEELDDAEEE
jgi:5-methylcytosine-specific restriction endonuclease McrA